ncbi:MAG: thiamine diphosphokinase [Acidimicrobiales bacterium]
MDARPRTAIVIAGGDPVDPTVRGRLPRPADVDLVIGADSGLDRAIELGLVVDLVVGDFDSADPEAVEVAARRGTRIERHPQEKDAIDLELAIDAARRAGARRVVVIGGAGGRLDMLAANLLLLAAPRFADLVIEAVLGRARVFVVRDELTFEGRPGDRLSLLPVNGPAVGVVTEGLRYPLDREDLPAGTSRGCSNELLADRAWVALEEGTLLCVLPGSD